MLLDTYLVPQTIVKPNMLPIPVRLDWAQLPPARSIRHYFRSLAAFTTWNHEGYIINRIVVSILQQRLLGTL